MEVIKVVSRVHQGEYEAKVPFVRIGQPGREEYLQSYQEGQAAFKRDALEAVGLTDHPKAEKAWAIAWDIGHANGLQEVLAALEELADLILD